MFVELVFVKQYLSGLSYLRLLFPKQEIVVGSNMDKIYIVMDYVEHDLKALMETMTQPFLVGMLFHYYYLFSIIMLVFLLFVILF